MGQATQWLGDKAKGKAAVNHIFHTIDRQPLIDAYDGQLFPESPIGPWGNDRLGLQPSDVKGQIEYRDVAFRYPSRPEQDVFTKFSLLIPPNKTVAFCGPSGSGKSTTIGLLQRFYDPTSD